MINPSEQRKKESYLFPNKKRKHYELILSINLWCLDFFNKIPKKKRKRYTLIYVADFFIKMKSRKYLGKNLMTMNDSY